MAALLRIVLFGPPGAGKGTQAQLLKDKLGIPHISSGDLFRFNIQQKTELGLKVADYLSRGVLVPDELGLDIVLDKVLELGPEEGFILDGFPRTREQAVALDTAMEQRSRAIDTALLVDVPEDELVRRLGGRFVCRSCQATCNLDDTQFEAPPPCDRCGGELYQRDDDRAEAIAVRIGVYRQQTSPVLDYYRQKGLLAEISGVGAIDDINRQALKAMGLDSYTSVS